MTITSTPRPADPEMSRLPRPSTLVSRNVTVGGRRTSIRLEPDMWQALSDICWRERASLHQICTMVGRRKHADTSLTAAIRVFVMAYFKAAATEEGHQSAGHGNGRLLGPVAALRAHDAMPPPGLRAL